MINELEDGSFERTVIIDEVETMIACDCNGDTWFKVDNEKLDSCPAINEILGLAENFPDLSVDLEGKTCREIHKFVNDFGDGTSEIKSGFYPINLDTRQDKTSDEEYQAYFDKYANADLSNISVGQTFTSEV